MSKSGKKYFLVSLDESQTQQGFARKVRRYLNSHKIRYIYSADSTEIKSYVDKVCGKSGDFEEIAKETLANYEKSLINAPSNQEILERWARSGYQDGSTPLRLLFGAPAEPEEVIVIDEDNESNGGSSPRDVINTDCAADKEGEEERAETAADNMNQSLFGSIFDDDGKKDEEDVQQNCMLCKVDVDVGRNRNTKIKRQAQHVLDAHDQAIFTGLNIFQRYQCLRCRKFLSVYKSPCEHIGDAHMSEENETEFVDLWRKEQLSEFNRILGMCFERQLPVPRSRRERPGATFLVPSKASYRIKQGDEVFQVDTIAEREKTPRSPTAEEIMLDENENKEDDMPQFGIESGVERSSQGTFDDYLRMKGWKPQ